jgi:hypothetical protein
MVALLITLGIVAAFDVLVWRFGADSRPGFSDGRTDVRERWFIH